MVNLSSLSEGTSEYVRDTIRNDGTLMDTYIGVGTSEAGSYVFVGRPNDMHRSWDNPRIVVEYVQDIPSSVGNNPDGINNTSNELQVTCWVSKKKSSQPSNIGWSLPFKINDRLREIFHNRLDNFDKGKMRFTYRALQVGADDPIKPETFIVQGRITINTLGGRIN